MWPRVTTPCSLDGAGPPTRCGQPDTQAIGVSHTPPPFPSLRADVRETVHREAETLWGHTDADASRGFSEALSREVERYAFHDATPETSSTAQGSLVRGMQDAQSRVGRSYTVCIAGSIILKETSPFETTSCRSPLDFPNTSW